MLSLFSEFNKFLNDMRLMFNRTTNIPYQIQKMKAIREAIRRGYRNPHINPKRSHIGTVNDRDVAIVVIESEGSAKVIPFWNVTTNSPIEIKIWKEYPNGK